MKTKNNVQKAILRTGAVVISFVLISFTVSAQDFWKRLITNSSFNEIAVAMIETESAASLPERSENLVPAAVFNVVLEPAMELENWMINEDYFYFDLSAYQNASESPLNVEDWMLNEENFTISQEPEKALELESWMVSDNHWNS